MIQAEQVDTHDGRWWRDENYSMEQWGWEARNGDNPPDYLLWVLQKYEQDETSPPKSLLEEIEHLGGVRELCRHQVHVPDEFRERYPTEDWQYEAENNDTRLGYRQWLAHKLEADEDWQAIQAGHESLQENTAAAKPSAAPKPRV